MKNIKYLKDKAIIIGRVFENNLQVISGKDIKLYKIQSNYNIDNLKDILIVGTIDDKANVIEAYNIYPLAAQSKLIEVDDDTRIFYLCEKDIIKRVSEGKYINIQASFSNNMYNIKVPATKEYNYDYLQVYLVENVTVDINNHLTNIVSQII